MPDAARKSEKNGHVFFRVQLWRVALALVWFGAIFAISFVEAPLKFQAPGITISLGLGIGRLVFAALNAFEGLLLLASALLAFLPCTCRLHAGSFRVLAAIVVVYAAKMFFVRPPLNARTDAVLAGADPGVSSIWHYLYIVCDVSTLVLLAVYATLICKRMLRATSATG